MFPRQLAKMADLTRKMLLQFKGTTSFCINQNNYRDHGQQHSNEEEKMTSEALVAPISNPSQPIKKGITEEQLERCSPLMKQILHNVQVLNSSQSQFTSKTKPTPIVEVAAEIDPKHDLSHFRHMLAGSISNQPSLDKFCGSKKGVIILDTKYDGQRTLISYKKGKQIEMMSRNGKSQVISFGPLRQRLESELGQTDLESIKMDGQIVVLDEKMQPLPLAGLMKLKSIKQTKEERQLKLEGKTILVYIFDVVEINGEDILLRPLKERREYIPQLKSLRPTQYRTMHYPEEREKIFEFFTEVLQKKYQGLILKGQNDKYYTDDTRSKWKKLKRGFVNTRDPSISKVELDLVVMGANRGSGFKNKNTYNSFLMGTPYQGKIIPISHVGTGINEEMLAYISTRVQEQKLATEEVPETYALQSLKVDMLYKPNLVFQIHAQEFTVSPTFNLGRGEYGGLSLRFPAFKGIREDKGPSQASTGQQILELSKSFNLNLPK